MSTTPTTLEAALAALAQVTRERAQQEDVDLPRLQQVVIEHLERMGQEPLQAEWQIQQL